MQTPTILQTNAIPVYQFLSIIRYALKTGETLRGRSILDCGAGGPVPPVTIFAEQGMVAHGIEINERQLDLSLQFASKHGFELDMRLGDMRCLPYEKDTFDYIYEHYSLCHLTAEDTRKSLAEFERVLKPGGLALFGVISKESWPQSIFGQRVDGSPVQHGLFCDKEANKLVEGWDILLREKVVRILTRDAEAFSETDWMKLRSEAPRAYSEEEWRDLYAQRTDFFTYVHSFYYLKKPE